MSSGRPIFIEAVDTVEIAADSVQVLGEQLLACA